MTASNRPAPAGVRHTAALGGGLIGQSWTALFLAAGTSVAVYDTDPAVGDRVRAAVQGAWPVLRQLGLTDTDTPDLDRLTFCDDPRDAVAGAQFIQESVPERLPIKHELYAAIEPVLAPDAIVSTSASGLMLSELQAGWQHPGRLVLGHPFNPPHLIPLVEVMGNDRTDPGVVRRAIEFYEAIGKITIEVKREVPGHVANRLQAALWREAISLVTEGVASVADVDKAVSAGPGIRWAVMGPTTLFHLGGGDGGLEKYLHQFKDSYHRWWDDLGNPRFTPETIEQLASGVAEATAGRSLTDLAATRDRIVTEIIASRRRHLDQ